MLKSFLKVNDKLVDIPILGCADSGMLISPELLQSYEEGFPYTYPQDFGDKYRRLEIIFKTEGVTDWAEMVHVLIVALPYLLIDSIIPLVSQVLCKQFQFYILLLVSHTSVGITLMLTIVYVLEAVGTDVTK